MNLVRYLRFKLSYFNPSRLLASKMTPFEVQDYLFSNIRGRDTRDIASPRLRPKTPIVPTCDEFLIELIDLGSNEALSVRVLELTNIMIPSWKGTQLANLKLTRITGALTNSIYAVEKS
ncbi:hypothetical protein DSO57_1005667 [Entomophthora muscae]|uniref:Uncharacterized protein n=1 Tax=Entomophthora muscae TaxID=34485 RepID=A0ACC2RYZ5_9FUNG|nr:hypothetical protein DSO57_1005667 [Entomophthora muscae]